MRFHDLCGFWSAHWKIEMSFAKRRSYSSHLGAVKAAHPRVRILQCAMGALLNEVCLGPRQFLTVEEDVELFVVEGDKAGDGRHLAHRVIVGPGDVRT
jgi:hypothetical protein